MKKKLLRVIVVYDDHALAEQMCQKWFAQLKSGNFDLEDEERPGAPTRFEDEELEARFNGFVHRIVTGDEKQVHYNNPKHRATYEYPGHASTAKSNIHGKKIMLCIWWNQLKVVYYELLQLNERIIGEVYQRQLMRLSRALLEKRLQYTNRHDKVIKDEVSDDSKDQICYICKHVLKLLEKTSSDITNEYESRQRLSSLCKCMPEYIVPCETLIMASKGLMSSILARQREAGAVCHLMDLCPNFNGPKEVILPMS
ncbi:hypothetical protein LAZ67_X000176 [Cordylochernes scorpioides]|uniref:Saposin B-type domain-containing protein n=1 Tax=Cordylochernes scorpioides TaxID=51811 RepID=A0ABY6LRF1_9ARAC|nr:hypothetical protein LAZ67_X000176 [Cordylochernes scorpioides]